MTQVDCYLAQAEGDQLTFLGKSSFHTEGTTGGATGSGESHVGDGITLTLTCLATDTFFTFDTEPIQVVATRIDAVTANHVDPAAATTTAHDKQSQR